jgi:AraC-like DNA-binding protein
MVMRLLYEDEHLSCGQYDHSGNPGIEVVKMLKGNRGKLSVKTNEIIFVVEGKVKFYFRELPAYEGVKGQAMFIPVSEEYAYDVLADAMLVIFRLTQPITLCSNYSIERLYGLKDIKPHVGREVPGHNRKIGTLEINSRLWNFLNWIIDCVEDGLKCRCWVELKIREFLLVLRAYYPKEELHDFFYLILSGDTAFSEYIRLYWQRFHSVKDMAASLNMTDKQFTKHFVAVFGQTPYRWMTARKAEIVYADITSTNKLFKEISVDRGFGSDTQLTRFCRLQFGNTPTGLRESMAAGKK